MRIKSILNVGFIVIAVCLFVQQTFGIQYTGSIFVNNGLTASSDWNSPYTSLSWIITDNGTNSQGNIIWDYHYSFTVPKKNVSHMIIEVSSNSNASDFTAGPSTTIEWGLNWSSQGQGNSNPNMPGEMAGLKFGDTSTTESLSVSFSTTRSPVWGDFYAKDGDGVYAWNSGFLADDPTAAPANDSLESHILRPDTTTTSRVPEPSSLLLIGTSLVGLFFTRKVGKN